MRGSRSIFDRVKLTARQLRTVADRRFDDAKALCGTRQNARANGAMYLGGFVVECLLKALLLERFRWLGSGRSYGLSRDQTRLWSLCYRSHELDELLAYLPDVQQRLAEAEHRGSIRLVTALKSICGTWTIYARYSPRTATITEADEFLEKIEEVREWLK